MRTLRLLLVLALFAVPVAAGSGGEDSLRGLVDRLFDENREVRTEAHAAILALGPDALSGVLAAIEDRQNPAPEDVVLEIHDVRDLVDDARPVVGIGQQVRSAIGAGPGAVQTKERGLIIVRASREDQARVRLLLWDLRQGPARQVMIEARIVRSLGMGLPEELGLTEGSLAKFLDQAEAKRVLDLLESRKNLKIMRAPRIVCLDQQLATITVGSQISYIKRYDREITREGSVIADPVVDTLFSGLRLLTTPIVSADGRYVTLDSELTFSEVGEPIATREHPIAGGDGLTVEVQVPEVRETKLRQSVTLPDGGSVLLSLGTADGRNRILLLLTARTLE